MVEFLNEISNDSIELIWIHGCCMFKEKKSTSGDGVSKLLESINLTIWRAKRIFARALAMQESAVLNLCGLLFHFLILDVTLIDIDRNRDQSKTNRRRKWCAYTCARDVSKIYIFLSNVGSMMSQSCNEKVHTRSRINRILRMIK